MNARIGPGPAAEHVSLMNTIGLFVVIGLVVFCVILGVLLAFEVGVKSAGRKLVAGEVEGWTETFIPDSEAREMNIDMEAVDAAMRAGAKAR